MSALAINSTALRETHGWDLIEILWSFVDRSISMTVLDRVFVFEFHERSNVSYLHNYERRRQDENEAENFHRSVKQFNIDWSKNQVAADQDSYVGCWLRMQSCVNLAVNYEKKSYMQSTLWYRIQLVLACIKNHLLVVASASFEQLKVTAQLWLLICAKSVFSNFKYWRRLGLVFFGDRQWNRHLCYLCCYWFNV